MAHHCASVAEEGQGRAMGWWWGSQGQLGAWGSALSPRPLALGAAGHCGEGAALRGAGCQHAPDGAQGALVHAAQPGGGGARHHPQGQHHQ